MKTYPPVVQAFVAAVQKDEWRTVSHPTQWVSAIAQNTPEHIAPLVAAAIQYRLTQRYWSLGTALQSLPCEELPPLIEYALDALQQDLVNESAEHVIEFVGEEYPQCLQPYLHRLLPLSDYADILGAVEAWRGAEPQEAYTLKSVYERPEASGRLRNFALRALFEMRNEPVLQALVQADPGIPLDEAGYTVQDGVLRKLFPDAAYHLRFPDDYPNAANSWEKKTHPTWHCPDMRTEPLLLGGMMAEVCRCRSCDKPIHHLLTLSPVPEELGVKSLEKLTLAVCLSCFTWEDDMLCHVFYRHDPAGIPAEHIGFEGPQIVPKYPAGPLKPICVELTVTPPQWHFQRWATGENLFRIGGHPTWVQYADYPPCPVCTCVMPFLLQLDSNLVEYHPDDPQKAQWIWGSGGIAYIFWCDHCRVSAVLAQWT